MRGMSSAEVENAGTCNNSPEVEDAGVSNV